jgi:hypothetical protein
MSALEQVGLRVRLSDEYRTDEDCVLRIASQWYDKAANNTFKDLAYPRTLLINVLDFAATNWKTDDGPLTLVFWRASKGAVLNICRAECADEDAHLYVELLNASTGQVWPLRLRKE